MACVTPSLRTSHPTRQGPAAAGKRFAWLAGSPGTSFANVRGRKDALVGCCPGRRALPAPFYRPTTHPKGFAPIRPRGANPFVFRLALDADVPDPAARILFALIKPQTADPYVRPQGDRRLERTWRFPVLPEMELRSTSERCGDTAVLWLRICLPCRRGATGMPGPILSGPRTLVKFYLDGSVQPVLPRAQISPAPNSPGST